jgi:hypothetical protein
MRSLEETLSNLGFTEVEPRVFIDKTERKKIVMTENFAAYEIEAGYCGEDLCVARLNFTPEDRDSQIVESVLKRIFYL